MSHHKMLLRLNQHSQACKTSYLNITPCITFDSNFASTTENVNRRDVELNWTSGTAWLALYSREKKEIR